jgi:Ca2+-binding EF-hand superfamily protein
MSWSDLTHYRMAATLLACSALTVANLAGCAKTVPPAPTAGPKQEPADQQAEATADATNAAAAAERTPSATDAEPVSTETEKIAVAEIPAAPERLLLLTPQGPLVVHLHVTIDGVPQRTAAQQAIRRAQQVLAKEESEKSSGEPQWSQIIAHERFRSGELGNATLAQTADVDRVFKPFDVNRDGLAQADELGVFLSQDAASGNPFSVARVEEYANDEPRSTVFGLLDQDADGRLSRAEIADAPKQLLSRDADDNQTVAAADFHPRLSDPMARPSSSEPAAPLAFELAPWAIDAVVYALGERYDTSSGVTAESFSLSPGLFAALDADENGRLSRAEMKGITDARPDLVLRVELHTAAGNDGSKVTVDRLGDDLHAAGAKVRAEAGRLAVTAPACVFTFSTAPPFDNVYQQTGQTKDRELTYREVQVQARIGAAADPLFGWLDVDGDGLLTTRELTGSTARLNELDRDGDGTAEVGDLPQRFHVTLARRPPTAAARRPQPGMMATPRLGPPGVVWAVAMDSNADGLISRREFLGSAEQFAKLDANQDGFVDRDEAARADDQGR